MILRSCYSTDSLRWKIDSFGERFSLLNNESRVYFVGVLSHRRKERDIKKKNVVASVKSLRIFDRNEKYDWRGEKKFLENFQGLRSARNSITGSPNVYLARSDSISVTRRVSGQWIGTSTNPFTYAILLTTFVSKVNRKMGVCLEYPK